MELPALRATRSALVCQREREMRRAPQPPGPPAAPASGLARPSAASIHGHRHNLRAAVLETTPNRPTRLQGFPRSRATATSRASVALRTAATLPKTPTPQIGLSARGGVVAMPLPVAQYRPAVVFTTRASPVVVAQPTAVRSVAPTTLSVCTVIAPSMSTSTAKWARREVAGPFTTWPLRSNLLP